MGQLHGRGAIRVEGGKGVAWGGDLCECTPLFGNDQLSGHDLFDEGGIRDSEGTRQRQWYERLCRIPEQVEVTGSNDPQELPSHLSYKHPCKLG